MPMPTTNALKREYEGVPNSVRDDLAGTRALALVAHKYSEDPRVKKACRGFMGDGTGSIYWPRGRLANDAGIIETSVRTCSIQQDGFYPYGGDHWAERDGGDRAPFMQYIAYYAYLVQAAIENNIAPPIVLDHLNVPVGISVGAYEGDAGLPNYGEHPYSQDGAFFLLEQVPHGTRVVDLDPVHFAKFMTDLKYVIGGISPAAFRWMFGEGFNNLFNVLTVNNRMKAVKYATRVMDILNADSDFFANCGRLVPLIVQFAMKYVTGGLASLHLILVESDLYNLTSNIFDMAFRSRDPAAKWLFFALTEWIKNPDSNALTMGRQIEDTIVWPVEGVDDPVAVNDNGGMWTSDDEDDVDVELIEYDSDDTVSSVPDDVADDPDYIPDEPVDFDPPIVNVEIIDLISSDESHVSDSVDSDSDVDSDATVPPSDDFDREEYENPDAGYGQGHLE